LGFEFLDTGAMYRVVAWACLYRSVDMTQAAAAADVAKQVRIDLRDDRVWADGVDVTDAIRTPEVTQGASIVATHPGVRREMVRQQRLLARGRNVVTEGRDQGTVAFPDADCKFFLTAAPEERARRRYEELKRAGRGDLSFDEILMQIRERDQRDSQRADSPLRPAPDAVIVDTTSLSIDEVVERLESHIRRRQTDATTQPSTG